MILDTRNSVLFLWMGFSKILRDIDTFIAEERRLRKFIREIHLGKIKMPKPKEKEELPKNIPPELLEFYEKLGIAEKLSIELKKEFDSLKQTLHTEKQNLENPIF